jgi:2-polyprenyl-6-hydroxyphenyl methylase/3-demethylubiquinone-9 3-methyltransferase
MHSLAPSLNELQALFDACGGTETGYLRDHYARFIQTRELLLQRWDPAHGRRMLDIGAHWLHQTLLFAIAGFEVTALDLERPAALSAIADDTFDIVLLAEVVEHLAFNPVELWREIHRILRPGGRIVITTPNYYALRSRLRQSWRAARLLGGGISVDQVLSLRTHGHHWKEYSRRELIRYFALLSPDFACGRFAYLEKRGTQPPFRRGMAIVRAIERMLPPLRPDMYLEVVLSRKDQGIVMQPHW